VQWPIDGLVLDQGRIGACVAMAGAHFLNTRPPRRRSTKAPPWRETDAIGWYGACTRVDRIRGVFDPSKSWTMASNDTGTTVTALGKVLRARGLITEWRTAFGLEHCRGALQHGPVLLTLPWYFAMFTPNRKGYIRRGGLQPGWHAVVAWADDGMNTIRIRSSWSRWWGLAGDALLTYTTLSALLDEGGTCTILVP
jgi:hypothetical protein